MKKLFNLLVKSTKDTSGQTIVESLMCSIIIMIILVGLLQVFHLGIAKLLTDYSAFRAARTYCVGFRDDDRLNLVGRSARVAAIGASGRLVNPDNLFSLGDPIEQQFAAEKVMIPEYLSGEKWWIEYEYWNGGNTYDPQYYNLALLPSTSIYDSPTLDSDGNIAMAVGFKNYPFPFFDLFDPKRIIFSFIVDRRIEEYRQIDINGSSTITNHASYYLSGGL